MSDEVERLISFQNCHEDLPTVLIVIKCVCTTPQTGGRSCTTDPATTLSTDRNHTPETELPAAVSPK